MLGIQWIIARRVAQAVKMKLMYVSTLTTEPDRDSSWVDAFRELGHEVIPFSTMPYHPLGKSFLDKLQRRLSIGPSYQRLQHQLLSRACEVKPQWVHFRLPVEFGRWTIEALRNQRIVVTQYFNDNPFSRAAPAFYHAKFRHALPAYDGHFVFRASNVAEYRAAGARYVAHCPPHYDPNWYPTPLQSVRHSLTSDVAFVGHWEDDWRVDCLDALMAQGFRVVLKGGMWEQAVKGRRLAALAPISHAFRQEFSKVYADAVAGLCFFSKLNRDTWTRRPLEIIASGGLLVCERTDEAQTFFKDREEAFFFSTIDELVAIVRQLRADPALRARVLQAGYARLQQGSHTIRDRALQVERFAMKRLASHSAAERW